MKDKKQGFTVGKLAEFFRDSTGHFNLGTLIAIAAFVMLCRIVEKDRHPDAWTVAPFTIIVVGYFGLDTQLTRAIARSNSGTPDTVVNTDTTNVASEQTTISDPKSLTS